MSDRDIHARWNSFVTSRRHASVLQSYEWGAFQESLGRGALYYIHEKEGVIDSCGLFLRLPAFSTKEYLYSPRGPLGAHPEKILEGVMHEARTRKMTFIRFEPSIDSPSDRALFVGSKRVISIQPENEWAVTIDKADDELLAAMHPKTRYNIRLANKKNVQVNVVYRNDPDFEQGIDDFILLLKGTSQKRGFRAHDAEYYRSLITYFSQVRAESITRSVPRLRLYVARHESTPVASSIVMFFGDTASYLHGGSSTRHTDVMAPYLLHWTALCDARALGATHYNFGGVSLEKSPRHPLAGVSRFKRGFGGETLSYPGTYDYILNPTDYVIYSLGRRVKRAWNKHLLSSFNG